MVVWYSHGNRIGENFGEYGRYSLHFMYAGENLVYRNRYEHNSVGIFFMYSQDSVAIENVIGNSLGTNGTWNWSKGLVVTSKELGGGN